MRKSCPYCGRIHDVMYKCPQAKRRQSRNKKTYEYDRYRNTISWQRKRNEIKERDMNMCQICVRGLYKYGARQDNYELRDENSNLISLCECHHKMADSGEIPKKVLQKIALEQEQTPPGH